MARLVALFASMFVGVCFVALFSLILDDGGFASDLLLDETNPTLPYPFTLQPLMWVMFFIGIGELVTRFIQAKKEIEPMLRHLLPEDDAVMLRSQELGPIYKKITVEDHDQQSFMMRIVRRIILQFQASHSINQANSLLNSSLELLQHETELRYNMLRYLIWLIPTLGFIGTVIGIALALNFAGSGEIPFDDPAMMPELTKRLGVAFYTTLLALMHSAVLVFLMHIAQAREESALNQVGQYCLDNLINRLYEK